jgi:hypothetical protein
MPAEQVRRAGHDITAISAERDRITTTFKPIAPGRLGKPFMLGLGEVRGRLTPALVVAAGLDRSRTPTPPPPVLWDDGVNRLLVHLAEAEVELGDGVIDVALAVECDETRVERVVCTFVTSSPKRPAGFAWASESKPRGPAIIVDLWGEALVALCWRALIEIVRGGASASGIDTFDRPLIASTVAATPDGFLVVPQAANRYMRTAAAQR